MLRSVAENVLNILKILRSVAVSGLNCGYGRHGESLRIEVCTQVLRTPIAVVWLAATRQ